MVDRDYIYEDSKRIEDFEIDELIKELEYWDYVITKEKSPKNDQVLKKNLCDRYGMSYHTNPEILIEHVKKELYS